LAKFIEAKALSQGGKMSQRQKKEQWELVNWAVNQFLQTNRIDYLRIVYKFQAEAEFERRGKMVDSNISKLVKYRFQLFCRRVLSGNKKINRCKTNPGQLLFFDIGMSVELDATELAKQLITDAKFCFTEAARRAGANRKNEVYKNAAIAFARQCQLDQEVLIEGRMW
jgi:hypothetical protein